MIPDETFPKKERLIKTKEFRKVYKDGRSFKADFVILKIAPNNKPTNRVGFSISAKSVKRAFRRNRIKRLFREAYRRNKKAMKKGFDAFFIIKRDAKYNFSYKEAERIFLNLSKQAGVLL